MKLPVYAVVMAGGRGTRLWPLSRQALPKQFLALQPGGKTLLQEAVRRAASVIGGIQRVLITAGAGQEDLVQGQLPDLPPANLLLEPVGRSTAPSLALAAWHIAIQDPQAVMLALPADHLYRGETAWQQAVETAVLAAEQADFLVSVGIEPASPATAYGYIHKGEPLDTAIGTLACPVFKARAFIEKPDADRAKAFVQSGEYLWNTGTFSCRISTFQGALQRLMPELYTGLNRIAAEPAKLEEVYSSLPDISVDTGVLEQWPDVAVVLGTFERIDVGNLASLAELLPSDAQGNTVYGDALFRESRENVVYSDAGLVGLLGVDGMVIIRHEDVVLVCPRERAHEVKELVAELDKPENEAFRRYR